MEYVATNSSLFGTKKLLNKETFVKRNFWEKKLLTKDIFDWNSPPAGHCLLSPNNLNTLDFIYATRTGKQILKWKWRNGKFQLNVLNMLFDIFDRSDEETWAGQSVFPKSVFSENVFSIGVFSVKVYFLKVYCFETAFSKPRTSWQCIAEELIVPKLLPHLPSFCELVNKVERESGFLLFPHQRAAAIPHLL